MSAYVYHFSPAGTTKRIASVLGFALDADAQMIDLADPATLGSEHPVSAPTGKPEDSDIAVFADPVFDGRVPQPAAAMISRIRGNGMRAASVVVYGNRDFDDALVELNDILARQGFSVIASGAFIARHSMLPAVAAGRPDTEDCGDAEAFAKRIAEKLASAAERGVSTPIGIPGNRPYKESPAAAWTPSVTDDCTLCGICAINCPVQAIPHDAPNTTGQTCFQCMRCASACPESARVLPAPVAAMISEKLAPIATVRKPNQVWV